MIREESHAHILSLIHGDEGLANGETAHLGTPGFKTRDGNLADTKSDDVDVDKVELKSDPSTAIGAGTARLEVVVGTGE